MMQCISIPYGAIKRHISLSHCLKQKRISIPYGAIKRGGAPARSPRPTLFQFLMVRLKGWGDKVYPWCRHYISIPYGAIKSSISTPLIAVTASFQFLMVRLKAVAIAF